MNDGPPTGVGGRGLSILAGEKNHDVRSDPDDRAGYDKIKADLDYLHTVEMPKILKGLAEAPPRAT